MSICGVLDGELSSRFLRHLLIQMMSDSTVVHPALVTLAAPAAPAVGYTASTAGYTALVASCSALAPAVSYAARTPAVFYAVPALRDACSACCELHRACCQLHRPARRFGRGWLPMLRVRRGLCRCGLVIQGVSLAMARTKTLRKECP